MIELELVGVRVEMPANQPIVLLREKDGDRYLPIWIGAVEATAIAFALQGVSTPRPMTHDLLVSVLEASDVELREVHVTELVEGTFHAELVLARDGVTYRVGSRTSDAMALVARSEGVTVYGAEAVLAEAGIEIEDETDEADDVDAEEEMRQFREFLDNVAPEDFNSQ